MKCSVTCEIAPCSPLKVDRRFAGTYHLHLQGWRGNQGKNRKKLASSCSKHAPHPLVKVKNLLQFYCSFITSRQWQLLFRCVEPAVVLGLTSHINRSFLWGSNWVYKAVSYRPVLSSERALYRKNNKAIITKERIRIKSGHGPQRRARYQDELVDWPSAVR
jgi:hypothetical protein